MSHVRPCHSSRLGLPAVRSGLVVKASSQTTAAAASGSTTGEAPGLKVRGPGEEIEPQVQAVAAAHEVLQLLVRLGVPEAPVDVDRDDLGHGQPERATDLAGQPFGHQGTRSLAGTAEFHDVQTVIVRFDEPRERSALAQGRDVAGGGHVARMGHRAGV